MLLRKAGARRSVSIETNLPLLLLPLLLGRQGLVLASLLYQFPVSSISLLAGCFAKTIYFLRRIIWKLTEWENSFIQMNGSTLLNQICFFMLVDRVLLVQEKKTSLYSLLFYNFVAYCFTYVKELSSRQDWSMSVSVAGSSKIRHLAMSATKLVLEWTKAVTFLVTVVTLLLVISEHHNMESPSPKQIFLTLFYYVLTEKLINKKINIELIQGLEHLYIEMGITMTTILLNSVLILPVIKTSLKLCILSCYVNVYLGYKKLKILKKLIHKEWECIDGFRNASKNEIDDIDDNCSICLSKLNYTVRVTSCQHYFHANCLRMVVKRCEFCPICKRNLITLH